jgi:hypothetical protein
MDSIHFHYALLTSSCYEAALFSEKYELGFQILFTYYELILNIHQFDALRGFKEFLEATKSLNWDPIITVLSALSLRKSSRRPGGRVRCCSRPTEWDAHCRWYRYAYRPTDQNKIHPDHTQHMQGMCPGTSYEHPDYALKFLLGNSENFRTWDLKPGLLVKASEENIVQTRYRFHPV